MVDHHHIETTAGKMIDTTTTDLKITALEDHHMEEERTILTTERVHLQPIRDQDQDLIELAHTTAIITTDLEIVETETTRDLLMTTNAAVSIITIIIRETPEVASLETIQETIKTEETSKEVETLNTMEVASKESTVDLHKGETSADLLMITTEADLISCVRDLEVETEHPSEEETEVVTQEEVTMVTQILEETKEVSIEEIALEEEIVVDLEAVEAIEVASVEEAVETAVDLEEAVVAALVAVEEAAVIPMMMMFLKTTHSISKKLNKLQHSSCNTIKVMDTIMIISSNMDKTTQQIMVLKITLPINKLKAMKCIQC